MQISVIIPSYNRASTLKETLNSALNQDIEEYEILVIDDGSTDATKKVVDSFDSDKIRYFYKSHTGTPETRNLGIKMAKGKYLLWLGSDDCLAKNILSEYHKNLIQWPEADVFFGQLLYMESDMKTVLSKTDYQEPNSKDVENFIAKCFVSNFIPDGGSLVKKSLYEQHGAYDPFFKRAQDYEFWSRVIGTVKIKLIPKFVQRIRVHTQNLSSRSFSVNYEIAVKKKMKERYSFQQLFPHVKKSDAINAYHSICEYLVGHIMFLWGGFEEACEAFKESATLNEVDVVFNALGESLVMLGKYDQAKAAFEKTGPKNMLATAYLKNFEAVKKVPPSFFYRFVLNKQSFLKAKEENLDIYKLFSLSRPDTENKRILELGPSLLHHPIWAKNASERTVIDPLAEIFPPFSEGAKIKFRQSDYSNIPFEKKSVDIITCLDIINFLENPVDLMQKCKTILSNNGLLLLSFDINLTQLYGPFLPNNLTLDIIKHSDMELTHVFISPKEPELLNMDLNLQGITLQKESLYGAVYAVLKKTK